MLHRYRSEESRDQAETVYRLRQKGCSYKEICSRLGISYSNATQIYLRECSFRSLAFFFPFIEYAPPRIVSAIRKSLGMEIFADPDKLKRPDILRSIYLFPGVGDKNMETLSEALEEAGYGSFDLNSLKKQLFSKEKSGE